MNPSTKTKPFKNGTFCRLQNWMTKAGVPHWDFHNVVPDKTGDVTMDDVDFDGLRKRVSGRKVVVCLGGFVKNVASRLFDPAVDEKPAFVFVDHPSPRNRNFNDPSYEPALVERLRLELRAAGVG